MKVKLPSYLLIEIGLVLTVTGLMFGAAKLGFFVSRFLGV